ncbi:MAG: DUF6221 family protein [Rhodoglobus sp.]
MTLNEFLLARFTEDEVEVAAWPTDGHWGLHPDGGMWMDPTGRPIYAPRSRVMAECEAKRQVIAAAFVVAQKIDGEWGCCHTADQIRDELLSACYGPGVAEEFLKPLALPYADHPDYLPEWKVDQ